MSHTIHPQARTTPKVRQEIKDSPLSATRLAALYNVTVPTIQKWKNRESTEDLPHTAHKLGTTLSPVQEDIVVELRRTLLPAHRRPPRRRQGIRQPRRVAFRAGAVP